MKMNYVSLAEKARAALIMQCIKGGGSVTYKELGITIGIHGARVFGHMRRVLDIVHQDCYLQGEPSLASLVVRDDTGAPGKGWTSNLPLWHLEQRRSPYAIAV